MSSSARRQGRARRVFSSLESEKLTSEISMAMDPEALSSEYILRDRGREGRTKRGERGRARWMVGGHRERRPSLASPPPQMDTGRVLTPSEPAQVLRLSPGSDDKASDVNITREVDHCTSQIATPTSIVTSFFPRFACLSQVHVFLNRRSKDLGSMLRGQMRLLWVNRSLSALQIEGALASRLPPFCS